MKIRVSKQCLRVGTRIFVLVLPVLSVSCQKVTSVLTQSVGTPLSAPSAPPNPEVREGTEAREGNNLQAQATRNSQILQEIYRVVWVMNPPSPSEFGNWLDSINQGASFEGVYNAFTHSAVQRKLESDPKSTATVRAFKVFADQMAGLMLEFPKVPELSELNPQPADLSQSSLPRVVVFAPLAKGESAPEARPAREVLAGRIANQFVGASIFKLKRVLGDWGLKLAALRREESQERLWEWYADFAVGSAAGKIDFGLPQRMDSSRKFHREWAEKSSDDLLYWEVLNRLHRFLNEAQGLKISESGSFTGGSQ